MIPEDISQSLEGILNVMQNSSSDYILFEDTNKGINAKIALKSCAMMNAEISLKYKEKEHVFKLDDFPIYTYHNCMARLTPIYHKLAFIEKNPEFGNSDLFSSYASTISNCILMMGENSLIKSENYISEMLPPNLRNEIIIVCAPIGDYFVLTVHFVKLINDNSSKLSPVTLWHQFSPESRISHYRKEFQIVESFMLKSKFKPQSTLLVQMRSLQMQLSSLSTLLSIEEQEIDK